uniref:Switch-associated protein 70 n=1 Tax=Seriola lalandi dorsalis TaxID=1841481 RepID=A0A3B4X7M9_SERLL
MALRDELLKSIWHAFTALDVDKSGKVSKSQLKVLSHNLCTVMKIPHDPVALEEHFKDDDEGPVSNQGYMPYLNKFILDKIEYFLRKLTEAMGGSWVEERFEDYKLQLDSRQQCLNAWELITVVGSGHFSKGMDRQTLSMGINEVYQELILDVLKQGYMMKKGHKRKNWTERWFRLKLNSISYYVGEDLAEKKGNIFLDGNCTVEPLQDKEGKKCLFLIRSSLKTFEISASDKKKKQEWIQAIQTCVTLLRQSRPAPHREARQKRRELRLKQQAEQEELELRMRELQTANEAKQLELENMRKVRREQTNKRSPVNQSRILSCFLVQQVRQQMEEQVAQKSTELEQYLQRVRELEDMYRQLEDALEDEKRARQDEEAVRKLQARLLEEEAMKRAELEQIHLRQQRAISETEAEKQELERERLAKESALHAAMTQLEHLEQERQGALEQYQTVIKKLEDATNNTKTWKHKVAEHEGLLRLIQPGSKGQKLITNWGPAAFSDAELSLREKKWQEMKNQATQAQ